MWVTTHLCKSTGISMLPHPIPPQSALPSAHCGKPRISTSSPVPLTSLHSPKMPELNCMLSGSPLPLTPASSALKVPVPVLLLQTHLQPLHFLHFISSSGSSALPFTSLSPRWEVSCRAELPPPHNDTQKLS